jgi:hypothetical protein
MKKRLARSLRDSSIEPETSIRQNITALLVGSGSSRGCGSAGRWGPGTARAAGAGAARQCALRPSAPLFRIGRVAARLCSRSRCSSRRFSSLRASPPMAMRRASPTRMERTTCRLVGIAFRDEAGAAALPLGHVGQHLRADEPRQRQVVEEVVHELFARDAEDEVVFAWPSCEAPLPPEPPPPAARPGDAVAAQVFLVAGVHHLAEPPWRGRTPARTHRAWAA